MGCNHSTSTEPSAHRVQILPNSIVRLYTLCDTAQEGDEDCWDVIRNWLECNRLDTHTSVSRASVIGDENTTPLHAACRNCPPVDVVSTLITIAPCMVQMADSSGLLPLHHASASGASIDVLRILITAFPSSKFSRDLRGRIPLHVALENTQRPASLEVLKLISSSAAIDFRDGNDMLPIHYACLYGTSQEACRFLAGAKPKSITARDKKRRTPLHCLVSNTNIAASSRMAEFLLSVDCNVVHNTTVDGRKSLDMLCSEHCSEIDRALSKKILSTHTVSDFLNEDPALKGIWKIACLLVKASYYSSVKVSFPDDHTWRMLHACSSIQECPSNLFLLAIRMHREQLMETDKEGNLPVHIASKTKRAQSQPFQIFLRPTIRPGQTFKVSAGGHRFTIICPPNAEAGSRIEFQIPTNAFSMNNQTALDLLIDACPKALQIRNHQQKLPLHLAIQSGKQWNDGLESIINAYPEAVTAMDREARLFPFMLAAVGKNASVDIIYSLLRFSPVIERFIGAVF